MVCGSFVVLFFVFQNTYLEKRSIFKKQSKCIDYGLVIQQAVFQKTSWKPEILKTWFM